MASQEELAELIRRLGILEGQVTDTTAGVRQLREANLEERLRQAALEIVDVDRRLREALVTIGNHELSITRVVAQIAGGGGGGPGPGSSIVDTRVLNRPKEYDGSREKWQDWSDKLKAFIGACSEDFLKLVE